MNYWQFKFTDALWEGFEKLEVGDVFDTTITEHKKLSGHVGDIVFWYRKDKKKDVAKGIYFVCEIVSEPRENESYKNRYSIDMRILKNLVDNPFILEKHGFKKLVEKINKKAQAGTRYLFEEKDKGEELYKKLSVENIESFKKEKIDTKLLKTIEKIKSENIENGKMFNPFLDMGLIKGEVKHLSFLANLFNPHGTHFQKDIFLKHFIKMLLEFETLENNKYLKKFNTQNVKVFTEKVIDNNKRIDIWIEDNDFIIAIEGKVEAKDSKNQLMDYDKFLKKTKKPYILIYLTKYGEEPDNEYPEDLCLLNFQENIHDCISESLEEKLHPKVKSTLEEYINSLTTYLYGLNPKWSYEFDIMSEIISSKKNFEKYRDIKNQYYYDKAQYKFSVVEDMAKAFDKSKALIELNFFSKICNKVEPVLEKKGFEFNLELSNILHEPKFIGNVVDVDTIYEARIDRINVVVENGVLQNKFHQICVGFQKKNHIIQIVNGIMGLDIYLFKNEKEVNKISIHKNLFDFEKISELLESNYDKKMLDKVFKAVENLLLEI